MHMMGTLRKEKERCQPDQASIHSIEDDRAQGSEPNGRSRQPPNGHGYVATHKYIQDPHKVMAPLACSNHQSLRGHQRCV